MKITKKTESKQMRFPLTIIILGGLSLLASIILGIERIKLYENVDEKLICDINPFITCGSVMTTLQAKVFGFPNMFLGIAGYSAILTTGLAILSGARLSRWYWNIVQIGITFATLFVIWLWYQSVYAIGALCIYCMVVWACTYPLFIYITKHNLEQKHLGNNKLTKTLTKIFQEWSAYILIIIYIISISSIIIHFWEGWKTIF